MQKVCLLMFEPYLVHLQKPVISIAMTESKNILCTDLDLCPHRYAARDAYGDIVLPSAYVTSMRGSSRCRLQRSHSYNEGAMVVEEQYTISFNDPDKTAALREKKYHWWVGRVKTADNTYRYIGSPEFPAFLTTDGDECSDTVTLTVMKIES